ncbi:UDP-GlcNAc:undecaprenyl-phosphate/decaprenyl-phosphate GlcNAc-1-phosphate transferase [Thermoflexales bacterium]|nr:UDP-GlcNAc:undecaprenyl-phosphate/decaprenyl-phosphate GlcNAc-1-phosphate transferase [Thermoflexales bacterium]
MTPFLLVFLLSFILSLLLTPLAAKIGLRLKMADEPGGRRRHAGRIARTGGLAIFVSFVVGVLITPRLDLPRTDPNEFTRMGGLLIGLLIVFVFGLLDDKFEFRPGRQFVAQAVASLVAIASLIIIERFNNPFTNHEVNLSDSVPWLIVPLSLFWLMGMMNTVNWLDGLDGLAVGIAAIFSAVLFVAMVQDTATQDPQLSIAPLPLALLGATLGFLPYNFHPARVFMGSSGSLTLGFALGCLGIIGGAKMATVLLALAVPIIDVAWLIVSRVRHGQSPFQGGRDHLHFRLLDLGLSQRQIVVGYYLISALFGGLALIIEARIYKVLALGLLGIVTLIVLFVVAQKSEQLEQTKK